MRFEENKTTFELYLQRIQILRSGGDRLAFKMLMLSFSNRVPQNFCGFPGQSVVLVCHIPDLCRVKIVGRLRALVAVAPKNDFCDAFK